MSSLLSLSDLVITINSDLTGAHLSHCQISYHQILGDRNHVGGMTVGISSQCDRVYRRGGKTFIYLLPL